MMIAVDRNCLLSTFIDVYSNVSFSIYANPRNQVFLGQVLLHSHFFFQSYLKALLALS